jgi:hypothetical protein
VTRGTKRRAHSCRLTASFFEKSQR